MGIGEAASKFAEGYRLARAGKSEAAAKQRAEQEAQVDRLFKMADIVDDPAMKETLFGRATDLMDQLENPPKAKKKGGIGQTIAELFKFGTPDTSDPSKQPQPAAQQPFGPPPVAPDSRT